MSEIIKGKSWNTDFFYQFWSMRLNMVHNTVNDYNAHNMNYITSYRKR